MRALVVEDHSAMRSIIRKTLEAMSCFDVIDEASNGESAWEKISSNHKDGAGEQYGLVICDTDLPVLDGISFLRRCRAHSDLRAIPFIMISTSPEISTVASALGEWRANDFIVKPFSPVSLQHRVSYLLSHIDSQEEILYRQIEELKESNAIEDALKLLETWETVNSLSMAKWPNLKGECLMKAGNLQEAASEFEKAMVICDLFVDAYKNYASAHKHLGNTDKAIEALLHIEDLSPTDNERTLLLGELLLQTGRVDEAKKHLSALIRRCIRDERNSISQRVGEIYLQKGLFKEAEDIYSVCVRNNPHDIELSNRLAIALRQQKKYDEAERCYMTILRRNPRNPVIYFNVAVLNLAKHDFERAEKYFRKALIFDPDFQEAKDMLLKMGEQP